MYESALDAVRNEVTLMLAGQRDWLEAITVARPAAAEQEEWQTLVEALLCDMHLDGVDVQVGAEATDGPWIIKQHLGPGWA